MPEEQVNYINSHQASVRQQTTRTAGSHAAFVIPYLEKLPPTLKFLDVGCGPGSITLDLAQLFPQAAFLGIDVGEQPIAKAKALLGDRNVTNAAFKLGDILKLGDDDLLWGTFDVVYCHQVLIHMQRPVDALKVMRRAAKPDGGIVAARESTYNQLFYPDEKGLLKRPGGVMVQLLRKNGGDPEVGLKLIEKAKEAGWQRDQITPSFGLWSMVTQEAKSTYATTILDLLNDPQSGGRRRAIEAGLLDEGIINGIAQELQSWLDNDAACATLVNGEIVCVNRP